MLKNQLRAGQRRNVIAQVKALVRMAFKELMEDGLQWADLLKFLRSEEFLILVLDLIGSAAPDDAPEAGSTQVPLFVLDVAREIVGHYVAKIGAQGAAGQ